MLTAYALFITVQMTCAKHQHLAWLAMAPVDPTYPLYPIVSILSSVMLLLVLLTSFIRQSWNLGVAFLCFGIFFENLATGLNAIIWSDNADIKLYAYCDIVSHLTIFTYVVKPMATLLITRRLYLIARMQTIDPPDRAAKRKELAIEWTLGLVIPLVVAGPLYYIVQWPRFSVEEGFGCDNSTDGSILGILLLNSWNVISPLVSITVYYPHVARIFYRQSRDINHFLRSNGSVSRTSYLRILALSSIDILITLPVGIGDIVLDWQPISFSYAESGTADLAGKYFNQWTSPILAFVIFALFGVTSEARASYWRVICTIGGWFGWKPTSRASRARSLLEDIEFSERPAQNSMSLGLESSPSLIHPDAHARERTPGEVESGLDIEIEEDVLRVTDNSVRDAEHQPEDQESLRAEAVDASSAV
ncbi:unnamed protein product [Peniophora sp. CBMAI 1063]|nr:unnamed protein product [Peniophora sp. CBMAI 1063]